MTISSKTVAVLGGTSGIGFAVARGARAAGADVVIGSLAQADVSVALDRLNGEAGPPVRGAAVDVTSEDSLAAFFAEAGPFDHLAVSVGDPLKPVPFLEQTTEQARKNFEIRFWGQRAAVRQAVPHLRPGGSITLTTGLAGRRATPGITVLGAVCGAVESLVYGLAVELAPLRINVVCPGVVDTGIWNALPEDRRAALYAGMERNLPVGRVGKPEDLAEAYLYLMRNGYSTGTVVVSDGGAFQAPAH